jgi:hypothetical protein
LTGMSSEELERRLLPDLTSLLWGLDQPLAHSGPRNQVRVRAALGTRQNVSDPLPYA